MVSVFDGSIQVGVRLPKEVVNELRDLARAENNGLSSVCRRLLAQGLELERLRTARIEVVATK